MGCNTSKAETPADAEAIELAAKNTQTNTKKPGGPPSAVPQGGASDPPEGLVPKVPKGRTYFDVEALLESVESGAIAPLKGRWLVELHEKKGKLRRRQELPREAFWSAAELRKLAAALGDDFGLLFVALSYRWLSKDHPDPEGFHLKIVAEVAALYLNMEGHGKGAEYPSALSAAFCAHGLETAPDFALFWDFASLTQKPRTADEEALFMPGLRASNIWYGHAKSVCWMQGELPEGFKFESFVDDKTGETRTPAQTYHESGWCFVEAAISAAIKPAVQRLDLALRTEKAMGFMYGPYERFIPDVQLTSVCRRGRPPPPSPEKVKHLLETEKQFTNKSDTGTVAQIYAAFFGEIVKVESLHFQNVEWGDEEAIEMAEVLPRFPALTSLDVGTNKIGPLGARAIGESLRANGSLTSLDLAANDLGPAGAEALAPALAANGSLTSASLLCNNFDDETVAMLLKVKEEKRTLLTLCGLKPDQTEADFSYWDLEPADAKLLAPEISVHASLTSLDLSGNRLCGVWSDLRGQHGTYSAEGIDAITIALRVNASLTSASLLGNQFDDEAAMMLLKVKEEKPALLTLCGLEPDQTEADFRGMRLGRADAKLLAPEIAVHGSLTKIDVSHNEIDQAASLELIAAMKGKSMVSIGMAQCQLGVEGAKAMAELASVTASLTKLSLGAIKLEEEGTKVICEAVKGNTTLKDLDLSGGFLSSNIVGSAGAKHVADMLGVNASLTKIDVRWNDLGDEGKAALSKAVEGRSSFELVL